MTPEQAINVLEGENKYPWNRDNSPLREAVKLGIEALKVVKEFRTGRYKTINSPLPGETDGY